MSEVAGRGEEIEAISKRLGELADELRSPEISDERAEELAREAADLVGRAGNEVERMLRADPGAEG